MRRQADLKSLAHGPENGRKLVHAGIAFGRKHPVQTFAGLGRQCGQLLKAHGGVDQVSQNEPGCFGFAIKEQSGGFIQDIRWMGMRKTIKRMNDRSW